MPYEDHFDNPDDITWIRKQLGRGNSWAWCQVKVTVSFLGFQSDQYLGGCSYESARAFRAGGYFEDLVGDGVEEIAVALEALSVEHGLWEHDSITCIWCVVT